MQNMVGTDKATWEKAKHKLYPFIYGHRLIPEANYPLPHYGKESLHVRTFGG